MARSLTVVPITFAEARAFVEQHHRHHQPPVSHLFSIGAAKEETIRAVAIVGRPVARRNQDGLTCELTRLASDGTRNACSFLYGRAWRAAQALGYKRMVTYTLDNESGASLRASGWKFIGETPGRSWSVPSRPRVDTHPLQKRFRWEKTCA
jgi:hypothetical protein